MKIVHSSGKMKTLVASMLLSSPMCYAQAITMPHFSIGSEFGVTPVYEGSSTSMGVIAPVVEMVAPTGLGTFTVSFPEGVRWDIPFGSSLGVALLGNYDPGRKESIRTITGGHNRHLMGMGDLGGTPVAGMEVSFNAAPVRVFVRGMQALRERNYGGHDIGRTSYVESGVDLTYSLSEELNMESGVFATWSDKDDMMSRFGVTSVQAQQSKFSRYQASGGLRSVTADWGLNWQWTQDISIGSGVRMTAYTSDARKSPLVDKAIGGSWYMNVMYHF